MVRFTDPNFVTVLLFRCQTVIPIARYRIRPFGLNNMSSIRIKTQISRCRTRSHERKMHKPTLDISTTDLIYPTKFIYYLVTHALSTKHTVPHLPLVLHLLFIFYKPGVHIFLVPNFSRTDLATLTLLQLLGCAAPSICIVLKVCFLVTMSATTSTRTGVT